MKIGILEILKQAWKIHTPLEDFVFIVLNLRLYAL